MTEVPSPAGRSPSTKPWTVAAVPCGVSLLLSSLTVGSHPYWQDSGFYLTAVHEFGILYPPGFVLYLLLCKGWTILLSPFCNFTLAVHFFSSVCAALAAGALALAALEFTRHKGAAIATGVMAAMGYTWAFAAIYAKGYALYYLMLSLLLWRLLRRDFTGAAILLGLSWAAHPSAALFGPTILVYLWVRREELRALGVVRWAGLVLVAAIGALGPILLLPVLAAREPAFAMGDPRTARDLLDYLLGRRFTALPGTWGFDGARAAGAARFFLEEFLVAGLVCLVAGLVELWRSGRAWIAAAALWVVPFTTVVVLFKIEGQYDLWLVATYLILYLIASKGIVRLARRWAAAPAAIAIAAVVSAGLVNFRDLRLQRGDVAERLGESYLQNLEPGAIFLAATDDAYGLSCYLQLVKGYRRDVCLINPGYLYPYPEWAWYWRSLERRYSDLVSPDFAGVGPPLKLHEFHHQQAAFINANARGNRTIYFELDTDHSLFAPGLGVLPAGLQWQVTVDGRPMKSDLRNWDLPLRLEDVVALRDDRRRGQLLSGWKGGLAVSPQSYRERLMSVLLETRQREAYLWHLKGTPQGHARAARLYESMIEANGSEGRRPEVLFPLASCYMALNQLNRAEPFLRRLLAQPLSAAMESAALWYLADVCDATGRGEEGRTHLVRVLLRPDLDKGMRAKIEARLKIR